MYPTLSFESLFIFKCELIISLVSGVLHEHMTLIWCLSPLIGFFLTPILGSLSDRCKSNLGRRRPFIVLLSIGVVLGEKIKDIYVNDMYCIVVMLGWLTMIHVHVVGT